MGLLQDDREWDDFLTDGAATKMCPALRELFITILLFCLPASPKDLFDAHYLEWADDFVKAASRKGKSLSDQQLRTLILLDIRRRLQSWDRDLKTFRLPEPSLDEIDEVSLNPTEATPVLIREELDFDINELTKIANDRHAVFTESQSLVFNEVMEAVQNQHSLYQFIDARGGTGKTFVLNAVLAAVRSQETKGGGSVALAVGTTGISSTLLHLGRTFHSRFKSPLSPNQDSFCNIDSQSTLADLIRLAKIIVIDEAPMLHRYHLEALDRTLRDLLDNDKLFGGKILICSGDFRQTLAVIPHAGRGTIVDASLNRSALWKHFVVRHLTENMRIQSSQDPKLKVFDQWTLSIGNGDVKTEGNNMIEIPAEMCMIIETNSPDNPHAEKKAMQRLANHVYPNLGNNYRQKGWMNGRAILAPTNKQVDEINNIITDSFPGTPFVLTSSDEVNNPTDLQRYNTEYLNTLSPSGLPSHRLFLKEGMPLMLMRTQRWDSAMEQG